ncbi:MAG: glycerophosphodiester phosphodiesterase family protein [Nocardioides sp.]
MPESTRPHTSEPEGWTRGTFPTPTIFAHRGASGHRPEHTIAAYELSVTMGADYIEPDLVMTKDGVLVDRHEPEIGSTTDVGRHPEFADRKVTKLLDGVEITGWWVEDFTLQELKSLRAIERLPTIRPRNTVYDGLEEVPTFDEVLYLRRELSERHGRTIGIIPEIKHSTYLHGLGFDPETATMAAIERAGLNHPDAALWIQSFELRNLFALRERLGFRARLVFLNEHDKAPYDLMAYGDRRRYADLLAPDGLAELVEWVDAIGPDKPLVIPRRADGTLGEPTSLVADAHAAGLQVIPWTFRAENHFLPADYQLAGADGHVEKHGHGRAVDEAMRFMDAGIDGLFCDNTEVYVEARRLFRSGRKRI